MSYEFCASVDRQVLGRRELLGVGGLVLYAERFEGGDSPRWMLDHRLMERPVLSDDPDPYPAVERSEAARIAGDASFLDLPPAVAPPDPHQGTMGPEVRLGWIDETIDRTLGAIEATRSDVVGDLVFGAFGEADYDYAHDELAWMKQAYVTVEALVGERELIRRRQELRRSS